MFDHVASPDVHVDQERRQIRMYFHGFAERPEPNGAQHSKVAVSQDGLAFTARSQVLGLSYFRAFQHESRRYAIGMPGVFYRSRDGLSDFEPGPRLFTKDMRHCALHLKEQRLHVFYSNAGDSPERVLHATVDLQPDWLSWRASEPRVVLKPEMEYEGATLPLAPSVRGWAPEPVRQLRDPCVFEEDGELYLLYSVAGEQGIAIARLSGV